MTGDDQILKVGEHIFIVPPIKATDAFYLEPLLAPAVSETLGAAALVAASVGKSDIGKLDIGDLPIASLQPVIESLCGKLGPDRLRTVTRSLLTGATMDGVLLYGAGGAVDLIDTKLRGKTTVIWRLLWKAVQVNYPDFFDLLDGLRAAGKEANPSQASTT